jgi:hypothetical protein
MGARPVVIFQKSSPSVACFIRAAFVKSAGFCGSEPAAGPLLAPFSPWQMAQFWLKILAASAFPAGEGFTGFFTLEAEAGAAQGCLTC